MLAIRHTVCSNHRQMYGLLGSKGILQHFDSVSQLGFFILVDGIDIAGKLHFSKVHHIVVPHDEKVYLTPKSS